MKLHTLSLGFSLYSTLLRGNCYLLYMYTQLKKNENKQFSTEEFGERTFK